MDGSRMNNSARSHQCPVHLALESVSALADDIDGSIPPIISSARQPIGSLSCASTRRRSRFAMSAESVVEGQLRQRPWRMRSTDNAVFGARGSAC
jgi:hypothetical protein